MKPRGARNDIPVVTITKGLWMSKCPGSSKGIEPLGSVPEMSADKIRLRKSYHSIFENDAPPGWVRSCSHLSSEGNLEGRIHG